MVTETYSTDSTALLLVDLLNDFLDENGKLAERIGGMLKKTNLKEHLKRLIDGARARGVKLFYVPHDPTFDHEVLTIDEFLGAIAPSKN
jgi:nicotinamidase-related amidase